MMSNVGWREEGNDGRDDRYRIMHYSHRQVRRDRDTAVRQTVIEHETAQHEWVMERKRLLARLKKRMSIEDRWDELANVD